MDRIQKFDILIHLVSESGLSKEKQLKGVKELFPKFDVTEKNTRNVKFLSAYVLEQYAYAKSLSMTIRQCAHASGVSSVLFTEALEGEGLDLITFYKLAQAELFAIANMKRKHLGKIDVASDEGNVKAAITFLEKVFPAEYGQKASLDLGLGEEFKKKWEIEVTHVKDGTTRKEAADTRSEAKSNETNLNK